MSYRTHRSSLYGFGCSELTEVPGTGNTRGEIHVLEGGVRFEVEDFIQLAWHVLTGPTSPRQSVVAVWALSTTTTEAINREPPRVATGATATLTATTVVLQ